MSEQWTWEPVDDHTELSDGLISVDGTWIFVRSDITGYEYGASLGDDYRLCRRAPAQGVPVEVREAINIVIGRAGEVGTHEQMKRAILDACELVADWLDSQQPQGQEVNDDE